VRARSLRDRARELGARGARHVHVEERDGEAIGLERRERLLGGGGDFGEHTETLEQEA
jgi:hypothetical protein